MIIMTRGKNCYNVRYTTVTEMLLLLAPNVHDAYMVKLCCCCVFVFAHRSEGRFR